VRKCIPAASEHDVQRAGAGGPSGGGRSFPAGLGSFAGYGRLVRTCCITVAIYYTGTVQNIEMHKLCTWALLRRSVHGRQLAAHGCKLLGREPVRQQKLQRAV